MPGKYIWNEIDVVEKKSWVFKGKENTKKMG